MAVFFLDNESKALFDNENKFFYRIMNLDRTIDLFENNHLVFASPELWNDPFERAFLQAKYKFNSTEFYLPFKPNNEGRFLYAQCWTQTAESEAFWTTYAPHNDGIRFRINALELKEFLSKVQYYNVYIGLAVYQDYKDLYEFKADNSIWPELMNHTINHSHLKLLLKKRIEFKYEQELRIILVRKERMKPRISKLRVKNIADKIDSIKIDPRMGKSLVSLVKETLRTKYGFVGEIQQSGLYREPTKNIQFTELIRQNEYGN